jgi:Core-2/I-Branching enzyme
VEKVTAFDSFFILVSESCVPVRPFDELRMNLRRDARSRMHVWSLAEVWKGGDGNKAMRLECLAGIRKEHAFFQAQWMCLSREDAMIACERDWTPSFEKVYAADECFFATVLAASGKPLPEAIANQPVTWTDWRGGAHPQEFLSVLPRDAARISESGCYFARKFPVGSDVGKWGLHRVKQSNPVVMPAP